MDLISLLKRKSAQDAIKLIPRSWGNNNAVLDEAPKSNTIEYDNDNAKEENSFVS